ncbi:amidohydrolase family protein [Geodermatophilus sp. URMC 64]
MLIRGAEVAGHRADVRVSGDRVAEVAASLERAPAEEVLDARGGALLPGLVDAHLHLMALATTAASVRCGPPEVRDAGGLAAALAAAPPGADGWVRGVGYAESVAGDLDAAALDRLHGARPVRVQHRSGALWVVNTAGAEELGLATADAPGIERGPDGTPTGRLWRADAWLRGRLPASPPDLAPVGRRLAELGITAVTDATPDLDDAALDALAAAGLPQRLTVLGAPLDRPLPPHLAAGPQKIVLADSGLPGLDELADRIRAAHAAGRAVAVHCVTREALVLLLAALDTAGRHPGDRVEHAALVPAELIGRLRGLTVVTQPGFLADRGDDYLRDVPPDEHDDLYRCRSLVDAGVAVALSSDAPFGPLDPWAVLAAAVTRRTRSGRVVGAAERLSPGAALDRLTDGRRVVPGAPADLVLLDRPLADQLAEPTAAAVRAVLIGGARVR